MSALSEALKSRSERHQTNFIKWITSEERGRFRLSSDLKSKRNAWWNRQRSIPRLFREVKDQSGRWQQAYEGWKDAKTASGEFLFTDGRGGTEAAMKKILDTLIHPGHLQHREGRPTHFNRAKPGEQDDFIPLDAESAIEQYHRHERKVLRDGNNYGTVHGPCKMLRFYNHWNQMISVKNGEHPDYGTPRLH